MSRIQAPPDMMPLRAARSSAEQIAALRSLKDDIIGHPLRKEKWVEHGVLEAIVQMLHDAHTAPRLAGKRSSVPASADLTEPEHMHLQALQLLSGFATGGPSFIAPIRAAGAVTVVLGYVCPSEHAPQIVLAALRVLLSLTDSTGLDSPGSDHATALADALFAPPHLQSLCAILNAHATSAAVREEKRIIVRLVCRLCKAAQHQNALVNAGVLDALATMLASFVVSRGEVIPGAELLGRRDGLVEAIPTPAPRGPGLALVLEAISAIIKDSRFRTCSLLCSPAIMAVFPTPESSPLGHASLPTVDANGYILAPPKNPSPMDCLLPQVPPVPPKSPSIQFPSTVPSQPSSSRSESSQARLPSLNGHGDTDDSESPLIPWLIHLVRSTRDHERVMAASVLVSLAKSRFSNPERNASLGVLVIPVLCRLLKEYANQKSETTPSPFLDPETRLDWIITEHTPDVLARLLADNEFLQQAAYNCGALIMAYQLLKDSYEPMHSSPFPRPWSPVPESSMDHAEARAACQLGAPGQVPTYFHKIRTREGALKLITSLMSWSDENKQRTTDSDVVPFIVESLMPNPGKPKHPRDQAKSENGHDERYMIEKPLYGKNPASVMIAACHVVRIMSRSVSSVRTVLDDHGLAKPILRLLKHTDIDVQIASCATVCNLVLEFSPLREHLLGEGVAKILCEHAHSLNPGLRLNAMWALRGLVAKLDNQLKKEILKALESGWLVRLIVDDAEDEALHARLGREHGMPDADQDEDMDAEPSFEHDTSRPWEWSVRQRALEHRCAPRWIQSPRVLRAEARLAALRELEINLVRKARQNDLAIQIQGLNFIRNLILPETSLDSNKAFPEMVEFVLSEIDQNRLFKILANKLRVKVLHPFARRQQQSSASLAMGAAGADATPSASGPSSFSSSSTSNTAAAAGGDSSRVLYPQAQVIEAVVAILANIAASVPVHRQLVVAQTDMLTLLSGQFASKDIEVKRSLCTLVSNLAWREDPADTQACHQRAVELRRLGFVERLEGLEQDRDIDVRERAREALWKIKAGQ